ncbi:MAG: IS3 family transposase [Bacteroidales bacterium]|nr:IS3 family transposase [Bacteroidales bacterium]
MSLGNLCGLFGYSRQAYYQYNNKEYEDFAGKEIILEFVRDKRRISPKIGARKLLVMMQKEKNFPLPGRDKLLSWLREEDLLVKTRIRRCSTTDSSHHYYKYSNLIRDFVPYRRNQLWVTDITYIQTQQGFTYLNLITDAYSRKIVGWRLAPTLGAKYSIEALNMAIDNAEDDISGLIHHSDRGIQYCCFKYTDILKEKEINISMTESGDPLENAIAERVNGILKQEWINNMNFQNIEEAQIVISEIIDFYNNERPHSSIDMLTPNVAHSLVGTIQRRWKNYYKTKESNYSYV